MDDNMTSVEKNGNSCFGGKMKKILWGMVFVFLFGVGSSIVYLYFSEDKEPPIIQISEDQITYTENESYEKLLKNVSAYDNQDGDVSDSLEVENIFPDENAETATVIFAAKDKHNNVSKQKCKIIYIRQNSETTILAPESSLSPETEETETEKETEVNSASKENPVITLTCKSIKIKKGENINRLSLIESMTDDKDTKEYLAKRVRIAGDEFDKDTPGAYKQIYTVVDSDGNKSNQAELTIIVQ